MSGPHVCLHLVREIMNMIRLRSNGDTLMHLALAGKGHLGILKYVAETHFAAVVLRDKVRVAVDNDGYPSTFVENAALRCLVRRYLQTLTRTSFQQLNFKIVSLSFVPENITKFINARMEIDDQLLNSLPNLETLVVKGHKEFFQHIKTGALHLKRLSCLTLKMSHCIVELGILGMLPLPHDNMLQHVKHLEIEVAILEGTPLDEFLAYLSAVLHCFPSVETSTLMVDYYDDKRPPKPIIYHPNKFIEWLEKLEVPGSFTMTYHEKYVGGNVENLAAFKNEVKSVGVAETEDEDTFVMVKTFRSVKFIYYVDLLFFWF